MLLPCLCPIFKPAAIVRASLCRALLHVILVICRFPSEAFLTASTFRCSFTVELFSTVPLWRALWPSWVIIAVAGSALSPCLPIECLSFDVLRRLPYPLSPWPRGCLGSEQPFEKCPIISQLQHMTSSGADVRLLFLSWLRIEALARNSACAAHGVRVGKHWPKLCTVYFGCANSTLTPVNVSWLVLYTLVCEILS